MFRDRPFDFLGRGGGQGLGAGFSSRFSSNRKTDFFSDSPRAKIFFSGQSKNKIFCSKQHLCSKCILLDLYVRVFLEPNIHGYIFICTCIHVSWIFGSECI